MSENWKIQISPKVGNTLINLRGDTPEEMLNVLGWAETNAPAIVRAIAALEMTGQAPALAEMASTAQAEPGYTWNGQVAVPNRPTQEAPTPQPPGPSPSCRHGAMTYKEGTSKNNKAYKGWFCPSSNRNDQCQAQWV